MIEQPFKYRAFISYSHADRRWGDWLHSALETYRVPRKLVGTTQREGAVPARVMPIFRDREELPTSSDLGANIREALEQSRFMIVICSPRAAQSHWVNEEILSFKRLGRENRILPVIVEGEPNASDGKGGHLPDEECFPSALRFALNADGTLSTVRTEPIAADARPGRDGRNNAKLKLLAGLLGVDYDALRQREHERQRRRLRGWLAASAAVSLTLLGLAGFAFLQKREADGQRQRANENAMRANEQRKKAEDNQALAEANEREARQRLAALYEERGRDELVKGQPGRAAPFLAAAYAENPNRPAVKFLLGTALQTLDGQAATLDGHLESVVLVSYDPRGQCIATADGGGTVKTWEVATGKLLHTFESKYPDHPQKLLFHDAAGLLLVAGEGTIRLCDLSTGAARTLKHGYSTVHDLALAPDGATFVSASEKNLPAEDATIKLWNLHSDEPVASWNHGTKTFSAQFSKDGTRLLTCADDGTACVWDLVTRAKLLDLRHKAPPALGVWSPSEDSIVTVGEKSGLTVCDAKSGQQTGGDAAVAMNPKVLEFNANGNRLMLGTTARLGIMTWPPKSMVAALEDNLLAARAHFSPDGKAVVVCPEWGNPVKVWSAETGQLLAILAGHAATPRDAVFSPDGRFITTVGSDRRAIVWAWEHLKTQLPIATGFEYPVGEAVFGVDGLIVAKPVGAPQARAWRGVTGERIATIDHPVDESAGWLFSGLLWSVSRRVPRVATAGPDKTVRIWDYRDGHLLQALAHQSRAYSIDLSADGTRLLSNVDSDVFLWDVDAAKIVLHFAGPFSKVSLVKLSPTLEYALVADQAGVTAWSTSSGKRLFQLTGHTAPFKSVKFTHDGKRILTTASDKTARLWDATNGRALGTLGPHGSNVSLTAISTDDRIIATYGGSGIVRFWRGADAHPLGQWETPSRLTPQSIAFWPQGDFAAVAVTNEVFYLDSGSGAELMKLTPHQDNVNSLDFSADGELLLTSGADRTVRTWHVSSQIGSPAEVQSRIERFGAWQLVEGQLVPRNHASQ